MRKGIFVVGFVFLILTVPAFLVLAVDADPTASGRGRVNRSELRPFRGGRAAVGQGTLVAREGTTLTVVRDGKTYLVLTDANTILKRRFGSTATLDEFQINDRLTVIGKWTNDTGTTIQAKYIRDLSIQKRHGVFHGTVTSLNSTGFVLATIQRGNQTVTLGSTSKLVNRRSEPITSSDIEVGHRLRVKGLWDRTNNTVTQSTHVKDYSLPPRSVPAGGSP